MKGLDFLREILNGDRDHPSICDSIPMTFRKVEEGMIEFEVVADERHLNPLGGVHGGFAATVIDSVTSCAVHSTLEDGVMYGTVDLNVKMVRPVPKHEKLTAIGKIINKSNSVGIAEGEIRGESGKLYACGSCICVLKGA